MMGKGGEEGIEGKKKTERGGREGVRHRKKDREKAQENNNVTSVSRVRALTADLCHASQSRVQLVPQRDRPGENLYVGSQQWLGIVPGFPSHLDD